ncbi:MAG: transglutaminase domain-containing protein [Muricomes sp.]
MMKRITWGLLFILISVLSLTGCEKGKKALQDNSPSMTAGELKNKYKDSDKYVFQDKVYTINDDEVLKLGEIDTMKGGAENLIGEDAFVLYKDYELKYELAPSTFNLDDMNLEISPDAYSEELASTKNTQLTGDALSGAGNWGIYDNLYLVQYYDMETGARMEKPYIYLVKVNHPDIKLTAPQINMVMTEDGQLKLTWEPVQGASSYLVIKETLRDESYAVNSTFWDLGEVKEPQWYSGEGTRDMMAYEVYSDDDKNDPDKENDLKFQEEISRPPATYRIFVVALDEQRQMSTLSNFVNSADFIGKLPVDFAEYTYQKEYGKDTYDKIEGIKNLPEKLPLIMADGSVRNYSVNYDKDKIDRMELSYNKTYSMEIPYQLSHSIFTGSFSVTDPAEDYMKLMDEKIAGIEKASLTGTLEERVVVENAKEIEVDKALYSDSVPEVPVKVIADSALEEYLAANFYAGKEFIDMSNFPQGQEGNALGRAITAVKEKNLLLPSILSYYYSDEKKLIQVRYDDWKEGELEEMQNKVVSVVDEVINDSMSDLEKAEALNQYLVDNAEYDYDAYAQNKEYTKVLESSASPEEKSEAYAKFILPYNDVYEAKGVLINKTGVCASYAKAFELLGTQAGLECAYITGESSSGDSHAWNYVKIDGQWRVMDVTWNDTTDSGNSEEYFNLALNDPLYTESHYPDAEFAAEYPAQ